MNTHEGNYSPNFIPTKEADGYMAEVRVKQLEKHGVEGGQVLREYTLKHAFPTNVSQIDLAYDSNDQIAEFTVEWQYSFFTAGNGETARATGAAQGAAHHAHVHGQNRRVIAALLFPRRSGSEPGEIH